MEQLIRLKTVTRLKNAKALGISIKAIARIAEVDQQRLWRFERESGAPSLSDQEIDRIIGALDEIKGAL